MKSIKPVDFVTIADALRWLTVFVGGVLSVTGRLKPRPHTIPMQYTAEDRREAWENLQKYHKECFKLLKKWKARLKRLGLDLDRDPFQ